MTRRTFAGPQSSTHRIVALLALAAVLFQTSCASRSPANWSAVIGNLSGLPHPPDDFYVIAHMTNTAPAVDWALGMGANGVEIDLRFDAAGTPTVFRHGPPCDCSCFAGGICKEVDCDSETSSTKLLEHLAGKSELALVNVDSKVSKVVGEDTLRQAGQRVVELLETSLFAKGYPGTVIISTPTISTYPYLVAAANRAAVSTYRTRIYFTIDGEGRRVVEVLEKLSQLPTKNRVYATGITTCSPAQFEKEVALAARNRNAGVVGLVYTWTLDKESSMRNHINSGTRGILSNHPDRLVRVARELGLKLATPRSVIPPATSDEVIRTARD